MILSEEDTFYIGLQRSCVHNLCRQRWCLRAWNRPSCFPASSPTWGLFLGSRLDEFVTVVGRMLLLKTEVPLQLVGGGRVTCGQNSELQCRVPNFWQISCVSVFRLLLFLALHSLVAVYSWCPSYWWFEEEFLKCLQDAWILWCWIL